MICNCRYIHGVVKHPFFIGLLLIVLLSSACRKKEKNLQWTEIDSPTNLRLNSVYFTDANNGHAVGGRTWTEGIYLHTQDAGATWLQDTLGNKELFAITFDQNNEGYAVGIDGHIFLKDTPDDTWEFWRQNRWFIMRDAAFYNYQNGVIVGGESFQFGKILKMEDNYILNTVDTLENELSAVTYSDETTVHVCGFGTVLRSTDSGNTFTQLDISGDFYRDIHYPTSQIGYIVGSSGSILKSTDAGASYETLRDGDKLLVSDKAFQAVFFTDENSGYIVGNSGLFWITNDGGDSWRQVADFPDVDLRDIFVIDGVGYIVGAGGKIFQFVE